jgi:hypothetical protein
MAQRVMGIEFALFGAVSVRPAYGVLARHKTGKASEL